MSSLENPQGMGLKIMNFRAAMIGAELEIDSAPGEGTRVTLSFRHDDHHGHEPLHAAEDVS
jgi:signal transduction histidine kinase